MPSCQSVKPISGNSTSRIDLDATARQLSGQAYTGLDRALTEQIRALISRLQALDLVRADIDGPALDELVFNNMNMMFHRVREARRGARRSEGRTGYWRGDRRVTLSLAIKPDII